MKEANARKLDQTFQLLVDVTCVVSGLKFFMQGNVRIALFQSSQHENNILQGDHQCHD